MPYSSIGVRLRLFVDTALCDNSPAIWVSPVVAAACTFALGKGNLLFYLNDEMDMIFNYNQEKEVVALLGAGSMGTAIVERIAANKRVFLGDISEKTLAQVAERMRTCGYDVGTCQVDVCDPVSVRQFAQKAAELGQVKYFILTAGASPNQATPEHIIRLDLIGTSYAVDAFGGIMAQGGAGLVISSMAGYMQPLGEDIETALALTQTEELHTLPCLQAVPNSGMAYVLAKRANHLRIRTAAVAWGRRGARINTISPGIIVTPLAYDEFRADGNAYQDLIASSPARRVGTSAEIAAAASFLLGTDASFITGIDLLMDGGVIAALKSGTHQVQIH